MKTYLKNAISSAELAEPTYVDTMDSVQDYLDTKEYENFGDHYTTMSEVMKVLRNGVVAMETVKNSLIPAQRAQLNIPYARSDLLYERNQAIASMSSVVNDPSLPRAPRAEGGPPTLSTLSRAFT